MIYKDGVQGHRSGGNEVFENCMSPGPRGLPHEVFADLEQETAR